jgi:Domain of unknown function (DUF4157)
MATFESDRGQRDRDQGSDAEAGERQRQLALPVPGRVSEDRSRLPSLLRTKMERAFGTDFSDVRIHEGSHAQAMGAVAYARGNDLYFQPGRYDPESEAGQRLLGHELAHVVQQRNGRVKAQGEGTPLNEDPALEAEAEEMGARAASGQATGMSAPAGRASGDAVQLYKEMQVGGEPWRLSEGNRILAKTSGAPGARTKFLWADPALVGEANQALIRAGSFIRLASDGDPQDVILRDGGRNATLESEVKIEANQRGGEDQQASYFEALNQQLERNEPSGVEERAHQLSGGRQHAVSKEQMESEYFEALNQRRRETRQTDRKVSLPKVIPRFEPGAAPKTPTYRGMKDQQNNQGVLYMPSDCNEAARVIMGVTESMRNERPVVGTGGAPQPRAIRDIGFGKQGGCGTIAEKGGLTGIADAMHAYAQVVGTRGLPQEQVLFFREHYLQLENEATGLRVVRALRERAPAVYADFTGFAQIDDEARPEIGDALVTFRLEKSGMDPSRNHRLYRKLVQTLTQILKVDEPRAMEILKENGLREDTIDFNTSGAIDQLVDWLKDPQNHESAQEREQTAQRAMELGKENVLWNKHWGGVVMQDGGDFVTLENDAGTANSESSVEVGVDRIVINQEWGFAMYGTAKKEQTFHHQMMKTDDFGDHATTMNFRRDRSNEQGVQGENENKNDSDSSPSTISLTPNEKQVLLYTRKMGATTKPGDLAKAMSSPVLPVLNARRSLMKKLDAYDMAEAILLAEKLGLLDD